MERLVFIVSQERLELFESLKRVLASERAVDIILDRRVVKRRHREEPPAAERRRVARRSKAPRNAEIPAPGRAGVRPPSGIFDGGAGGAGGGAGPRGPCRAP